MLIPVPTTPKSLEDYRSIVGDAVIDEIVALAAPLQGMRVLHVNSTAFGGGVAELLRSLVPLMAGVGLQADWRLIRSADEFFVVSKAMHNALQGMSIDWTSAMRGVWLGYNQMNAQLFDEEYDFVIVHDPQPAGILAMRQSLDGRRPRGLWIWRCHIDMTHAQPEVWDFLRPYVEQFDACIFTLKDYVKDDLTGPIVTIIPPAIDPVSPKNADLPAETVATILERYGIDTSRPFLLQVSRFDPWKDPLGVIDVYRAIKQEVPEMQLALLASMAHDDPEGWTWYERVVRHAGEDFDIHILSNLQGLGNLEVNAFQRRASVVVQKSIREGFGLTVTEALWKERPVVATKVGGIPLQVISETTGYLADGTDDCIRWIRQLLAHPQIGRRLGQEGREHVRRNFLITRYLRDYLQLFQVLLKADPKSRDLITRPAPMFE